MTPRFLMPATAPLRLLLIVMHILIPVLTLPAQAQQDNAMDRIAPPEQPEERNCLSKSHIRSIKTVDDDTLLFHMRGSKKYVNRLPRTCQGLTRYSLVHRTPMNSYCSMDIITVMDMQTGIQMGSCTLGSFEAVIGVPAFD